MISMQQHLEIKKLLDEWAQLCQLYSTVQQPGHMTVQVMGSSRPEFYEEALEGAKRVLKAKAMRIKADLQQLDFTISQLPAMMERPRESAKSD